jgi:hypothetical protein
LATFPSLHVNRVHISKFNISLQTNKKQKYGVSPEKAAKSRDDSSHAPKPFAIIATHWVSTQSDLMVYRPRLLCASFSHPRSSVCGPGMILGIFLEEAFPPPNCTPVQPHQK